METTPQATATFVVESGCICFGELHNVWSGSSVPIQVFPSIRPECVGTVVAHHLEFNVPAHNGRWNAFHLVDIDTGIVSGWFLCHSDVDVGPEIQRILRVSGSPYEPDCGSTRNDGKTHAEGILVVNRYDWGYYDARCRDEIDKQSGEGTGEEPTELDPEDEGVDVELSESVGVVDYAHAKSQVAAWKRQSSDRRNPCVTGVWMEIPMAEHKFGRFGFNLERTAAHSFLFFSTRTDFTRTSLAGQSHPLRKPETNEERFERRLREGFDFSGLQLIQRLSAPPGEGFISFSPPAPPESTCLGPYSKGDHVLRGQELDSLRLRPFRPHFPPELIADLRTQGITINTSPIQRRNIAVFVDPEKDRVFDLINELILSYLERSVLPALHWRTPSMIADALFGKPAKGKLLDVYCHCCLTQSATEPIPDFEVDYMCGKIKTFLNSRAVCQPSAIEEESIRGICRVIAYLVSEILELSCNAAIDSYRYGIVPLDIRISVYNDPELYNLLQYSTVLWKGRG
ncbi:hypothetical protein BDV23DRAFT_192507 [Aspergillus alliaceus]|uniref:Uncharacterized protein n=1 Tax=Petromyces alliaceus TaxID=209559 RepID=A0A5N7CEG3_PETAA|nr:hypothetical protein BDV23DRAFT_192507 [Aspergillus alliaceus]